MRPSDSKHTFDIASRKFRRVEAENFLIGMLVKAKLPKNWVKKNIKRMVKVLVKLVNVWTQAEK